MIEITPEQIREYNKLLEKDVRNIFRKYEISDCEYELFGWKEGCQCIAPGQLVGYIIFFAKNNDKNEWELIDRASTWSFAYAVKEVAERLYRGDSKIELLKELGEMFKERRFTIKEDYIIPTKHIINHIKTKK